MGTLAAPFNPDGFHFDKAFLRHEVAGAVTTFNIDDFQRLDAPAIDAELRRLPPPA